MDANTASLATLGATQTFMLFTALAPSRGDLYSQEPNDGACKDLRQAEAMAGILSLGFSGVVAYIAKSRLPLIIGALSVAAMVLAYEATLWSRP